LRIDRRHKCWNANAVSSTVIVATEICAPPAVVFDLELDMDEHSASLRSSGEIATTSTGRSCLSFGDEVTFVARHFGLRFTMTSRITAYERPYSFTDEQVRGPFKRMRHEHVFSERSDGGTRMEDRMTAEAPFGAIGRFVMRFAVAPYMRRLLKRRAVHIKRQAELYS
jgi:ligand-binding SRPBCC domain-containing protein